MSVRESSMTVLELARGLNRGAITPRSLFELRMKAIRRHNDRLNAFISVLGSARAHPRQRRGRLHGITIAAKDNIYAKGVRATAGSKILKDFVPGFDAEVLTKLKAAGAVLIGKTNQHEFAFGVTNINPHWGDCRNPWDVGRVSGGSSGGSAVAVAQGMACAAVGTDTAGSVRIPAALCGVVGYKPTTGLVSSRGTVPLSWSLDAVGFLTRSVADAAFLCSTAVHQPGRLGRVAPARLKGLRLGIPVNMLDFVEEDVKRSYDDTLAMAESRGARLIPFRFPHYQEAIACRSLVTHAEAASYHRWHFIKRYDDYGPDLQQRLAQGLAIPAAVYVDALRARRTLVDGYRSLFRDFDLIALPTTRIAAPTIEASRGGATAAKIRKDLLAFTEPFNVYGAPAISIPSGLTREGLPIGFHLAGNINSDALLLSVAQALEEDMPRILGELPN